MIELAWVPFVVLLLVFGAYVAENWPKSDPFDDEAYDRRHQAHFRQAHPTPLGESQPDFARRGDALCRDAVAAFRGSPVVISPRGRSG